VKTKILNFRILKKVRVTDSQNDQLFGEHNHLVLDTFDISSAYFIRWGLNMDSVLSESGGPVPDLVQYGSVSMVVSPES
jgi:hypothetical protein